MSRTLVSWLGNQDIESFSPNCCAINRILSILESPFLTHSFAVSADLEKINVQIKQVPILIEGKEKICGIDKILSHLEEANKDHSLFEIPRDKVVINQHLIEWALSSLRASVIYFSYIEPTGFKKMKDLLSTSLKKSSKLSDKNFEEETMMTRQALGGSIQTSQIVQLDMNEALDYLDNQFQYISETIGNQPYMLGEEIKVVDIILFVHFNRMFLPGLAPAKHLKTKHYRVLKWLERVAIATKSEDNIFPAHLQS